MGKRSFGRPRFAMRIILNRTYGKIRWVDKHWIRLTQYREKQLAFIKEVMENWF
jgi:hypothetical protein